MTDQAPPPKRKAGRPKGSTSTAKKIPTTFKARMAEYERTMPKLALNDHALLQAAVNMEIEFPKYQQKIAACQDGREAAKFQEAYNISLKEYRQILSSLGIERGQRSTDIDMQQEIDRLVEESRELVDKVGIKLSCAECDATLELGVLVFHFRDDVPWLFEFLCPRCQKRNRRSGIRNFPLVIEGTLSG